MNLINYDIFIKEKTLSELVYRLYLKKIEILSELIK